ncbi:MAG TPA: hypothetical protein VK797_23230 [Tepidisphaeraceae bacterium]|nr:hypothetical protein [Tepidisphaeraceae bacterium]
MTDDAPAIQAALLKGGKVSLNPGQVYNIASHIVVNSGTVWLEGNGAILRCADTFEVAAAAGDVFQFVGCDGLYVGDLAIDQNRMKRGNAPNCDPVALRLLGCQHFLIRDCNLLDSPADSIRLAATDPTNAATACIHGRITGCYLDGAWRNLISAIGAAFVRFDHNRFFNAINGTGPNAALDIEPNLGDAPGICHDLTIDHNYAANCLWGFTSQCTLNAQGVGGGTHDLNFLHNTLGSGITYGIVSDALRAVIHKTIAPSTQLMVQGGADSGLIDDNIAGGIYADTTHVATPVGHIITNNRIVPGPGVTGVIDVHYCYGKATLANNVGAVTA